MTAEKKDENVSRTNMGVEKLSINEIKRMPALMGEVDVIKAIQLLPGVQPTAEGSSGYSVRGGSADQNLIVLDNATVYNASHMFAFGILCKRKVRDRYIPIIAILSPVLCYILQTNSEAWFNGYSFSYELLIFNALFTCIGLWLASIKQGKITLTKQSI